MTNDEITKSAWTDLDDAPRLAAEWFEKADAYVDTKLVDRGRPKSADRKQLVSLRLDAELLARLRAGGPGWQTRVNETLRKAVGL